MQSILVNFVWSQTFKSGLRSNKSLNRRLPRQMLNLKSRNHNRAVTPVSSIRYAPELRRSANMGIESFSFGSVRIGGSKN